MRLIRHSTATSHQKHQCGRAASRMAISAQTLKDLEQLRQQQALVTSALVAMVSGQFGGSNGSVEAYLDALNPSFDVHAKTPEFECAWWNPRTPRVLQNKTW